MTATAEQVDAEDLIELVGQDPHAALAAADDLVGRHRRPRAPSEVRQVVLAQRAAGLALRGLGDPSAGERRVRAAVALAERTGDRTTAAEARTTQAFLLLELGRTRAALTATDLALSVLRGVPAARTRATRALVLHRESRFREAYAEYGAALTVFRRAKDRDWEARVLHNRGLLSLELGDTDAALDDLAISREYSLSVGQTIDAADALFNMGIALECAGDIPAALALFDRADEEWGDIERPQRWLGRVDAYLSAGLVQEAVDNARAAVDWLSAREWAGQEAHAHLSLATCLLASQPVDVDATTAAAATARAMFRAQDRREAEAVAEYVLLKARVLQPGARWETAALVEVALRLTDAGNESAAADLRSSAGSAAIAAGDVARARVVLGPLTTRDRARQLDVRTRAWFARALLAEADGDRSAALAALRRSWQTVETQRSLLGATELRAASGAHAAAVVDAGIRLGLADRSAVRVLEWSERGRSAALRYRPVLPPDDKELARALARLRTAARTQDEALLDGEADRSIATARARSEAEVLRLTRRAAGTTAAPAPVTPSVLRSQLRTESYVQYVDNGESVRAVVVRNQGVALHDLGPVGPIAASRDTAAFALRRILTGFGTRAGQDASVAAVNRSLAELDAALVAPLRLDLDEPVVVCPSASLNAVPWSALPSFADGRVTIAPSASMWCRIQQGRVAHGTRLLGVAGPGLAGAVDEVTRIAEGDPSAVVLTGTDARVDGVLRAARDVDVLHIAAHGVLRRDNPLFSAIELADGPLTGYDLESLDDAPACVVLSACSAGAGRTTAADETLGLAWTLMSIGTRSVVAPLLPVPDSVTTDLMVALHRGLRAGAGAADALTAARRLGGHDDPVVAAVAAAFVCYGA